MSLADDIAAGLPPAALRDPAGGYLSEPRSKWRGRAALIVAPGSTDEVAEVVRRCAATRTPIVPYGGGTGLVGGQVAPDGPPPVVLSLERMSRIRAVHADENVLVADAGATLAEVQAAAADADRLFPLSYASEGTARIGGALSANSGGLAVLRYGMARALCLGIEAVLPDGQVHHGLVRLRKDNTGYSLRDLLIGAEGTLGVITAASLRLFPRPARTGTALLALDGGPAAGLALLSLLRDRAGDGLSAAELIHREGLEFRVETGLAPDWPMAAMPEWSMLVEIGLSTGDPDQILEDAFVAAAEAGIVTDGVVARSEAQRADLWAIRETLPEANRLIGAIASHDVALPLSEIAAFDDRARAAMAKIGPMRINAFGHLGDGNLHWNLFPPKGQAAADWKDRADEVSRTVHDLVHAHGGSISAEHGIGRLKVADLERYGDPAKLSAMRAIKAALDPLGIMNPGAVLRP